MRSMRLVVTTALAGALVLVPFIASGSAATGASSASCSGAVSWRSAPRMVGRVATIKGPVRSTKYASYSNGSPTFLDIGRGYPSPSRFTVVIWGSSRSNFSSPENKYYGRTICVRGLVRSYDGHAEIHASSPSQIAIA